MTGGWHRDLNRDLDTIRNWGAAAVVTLLEPAELTLLKVERLGEEVLRRNMSWFHLPIADVSTPDERFEQEWDVTGEELRSILRSGLHDLPALVARSSRPAHRFEPVDARIQYCREAPDREHVNESQHLDPAELATARS
jgi:hypothetical protein